MAPKRQLEFNPEDFLAKISVGKTMVKYRKDEIVFSQGDQAESIYFVHRGKAKVVVVSEQGKEAVIAIVEAGSFLGEGCLGGERKRMATVSALQDCIMYRVESAAMLKMLHQDPGFSDGFIKYLLARNSRIQEDLVDQLFNSSEKRLARLLLILANFGKKDLPEAVTPKISQETLAEMIGTTRARVSYFMNKFRRLGLIEYNGDITVHRSLLTVVLSD